MSEKNTSKLLKELFSPVVDEIRIKSFFSYYAVMKDDAMFALYKNDNVYLYISKNIFSEIEKDPNIKKLLFTGDKVIAKNFYQMPDYLVSNLIDYKHWIIEAIKEIKENRSQEDKVYSQKGRIRNLPNMTIQIERLLQKIGITTVSEFMAVSEIDMCIELFKSGTEITHNLLFRLYGARKYRYIYTFSQRELLALLKRANEAFKQANICKYLSLENIHKYL